jgi:peptide/nickel transport system ATP-binding protein
MGLSKRALGDLRGPIVSMVFQEPRLALDPVYTLGDQITETIRRHEKVSKAAARDRALKLFQKVRIPSPERRLDTYPHEMSGGMLQRSMIAMAIACNPKVLLADEPTTALDATVQIQILLLIRDLQREYGLAVIFVTHDIGVAAEVADRIAVMYAGRIVEEGRVADIIREPQHPYTMGLLGARVELANGRDRLVTIPGSPPDLSALPPGCAFAPRCERVTEACRAAVPPLFLQDNGSRAACIHPG